MNSRHPDKRVFSAWIHKDKLEAFRSLCERKEITLSGMIEKLMDRELAKAARSKTKKA